jgi:hypothetical protein
MVGWRNNFGPIESGNSDIDFVGIGVAHESQCTAARAAERAEAPGPCDFARFARGKSKIAPAKRSPGRKRRTGALATIFAMTMSDVVGLTDPFISQSTAQATTTNPVWLRLHHKLQGNRAGYSVILVGQVRASGTTPHRSLPRKLAFL